MADEATAETTVTSLEQARARIADLAARLDEATLEVVAHRDRAEAAVQQLEDVRVELATVQRELDLIRCSRSYQAVERVRRLLGR